MPSAPPFLNQRSTLVSTYVNFSNFTNNLTDSHEIFPKFQGFYPNLWSRVTKRDFMFLGTLFFFRKRFFSVLVLMFHLFAVVCRVSSVCIATRCLLQGLGIESLVRRDFLHPSRPSLGPTRLLRTGYSVFPWGKAAGAWRWQAALYRAEVKERVELYLYSPLWPWPLLRWTLHLPLLLYLLL